MVVAMVDSLSRAWCAFSLLVALSAVSCAEYVVPVNYSASNSLQYYLCGEGAGSLVDGITLGLSTLRPHIINSSELCFVKSVGRLTIRPVDSGKMAVVQCFTGGFAFFNMGYLTIKDVRLQDCGAPIPAVALRYINITGLTPIPPHQSAALVLNHCYYLLLRNVQVNQYIGFGLLAGNLYDNSVMVDCVFNNTGQTIYNSQTGSGVLFLYVNSTLMSGKPFLNLTNVRFTGNFQNRVGMLGGISDQYSTSSVHLSAGFNVIFAQSYEVDVVMTNCSSDNNRGVLSGGGFVHYLNYFGSSRLVIRDSHFTRNIASPNGMCGGLLVYFTINTYPKDPSPTSNEDWTALSITNGTEFKMNGDLSNGISGAIVVLQFEALPANFRTWVTLDEVIFHSNMAEKDGTCSCLCASFFAADSAGVSVANSFGVNLTDITAASNGADYPTSSVGMMTFKGLREVHIIGTDNSSAEYHDNFGSVVKGHLTEVHLHGNLIFRNNRGLQGAVFQLSELAYLVLEDPLVATFISNKAFVSGGVLYSAVYEGGNTACVLQYSSNHGIFEMNISLIFINNTASTSGNDISAYPLYDCYIKKSMRSNIVFNRLYDHVFTFAGSELNSINNITSKAISLTSCTALSSPISPDNGIVHTQVYAGQNVFLSVAAKDAGGISVFTAVIVHLYNSTENSNGLQRTSAAHISLEQQVQLIEEGTCTDLSITILSSSDEEEDVVLTLSLDQPFTFMEINIKPCPQGFTLLRGVCSCDTGLISYWPNLICNISDTTIYGRPAEFWVGGVGSTIGYSTVCQEPERCRLGRTSVNMLTPDDLCSGNRSGVLCGGCSDGSSEVLGGEVCWECSSVSLLLLPVFAGAGIILVVTLICLRITVSAGTIGGLVFYANISQTSILHYITADNYSTLRVFIAAINMDMVTPACLYAGMTGLQKSFLQFLFPIYLWLLVIVIILGSKYSVRLSRVSYSISIQVFATVIFLSYSKLLQTSLFALIPAPVHYGAGNETKWVWFRHGNLNYFSFEGGHGYLGVVAIMILLIFVIPYTILITVGSKLMKYQWFVTRFRSLIDAYHGPYKDKWRFWCGVRLWVMLYAFLVYSCLRQYGDTLVNVLELLLFIPFLLIQSYIQPYKNKVLNFLDLLLMANLTLATAVLTLPHHNMVSPLVAVSVSVTLVVFLMIIVYHTMPFFLAGYHSIKKRYHWGHTDESTPSIQRDTEKDPLLITQSVHTHSVVSIHDNSDSDYRSITTQKSSRVKSKRDELRESLLSFVDNIDNK